jgi:hypothetical protein
MPWRYTRPSPRMVGSAEVPELVAQFLAAHIATVEQLDVLLLLVQTPDRWWDARTIGGALGLPEQVSRRTLDALASQNLLAIRITGAVRYQYQPGRPGLDDAARLTADTCRTNHAGVLRLVTHSARRNLRAFADAFRIRRDDDR